MKIMLMQDAMSFYFAMRKKFIQSITSKCLAHALINFTHTKNIYWTIR